MESFSDCSAGTKDDQYKHNFFTIPQMLRQLILSLGIRSFLFFKTYWMAKWASNIYVWLLSFLSTATMSGLLCSILWSVWIGKSHSNLHSSDSYSGFGSWSCQFREQSKPNFWQSLQWTHFPTWSSLQPLYSFWANLSHSITMCLTESSCSRHILHNGGISSPSILFYYPVGSQRLILGSHYEAFCFFLQNAFS